VLNYAVQRKINIKYYIEIQKLPWRFIKKVRSVRACSACGRMGMEMRKRVRRVIEREEKEKAPSG